MRARSAVGGKRLEDIGKGLCGAAIVWAAAFVASCSEASREPASPPTPRSMVVLVAPSGVRDAPGPIQGTVRCGDGDMPAEPPCMAEDLTLARAVLDCGPVEATIDRGASHVQIVKFPAGLHARFPSIPADLEVVRCVRGRVGFSFSAGLATEGREDLHGDETPFEALHSKPAAESGER